MTDHVKTLAGAREHLIDSIDAYFANAELEAVDVVNALDAYLTERAKRPPEPVATSEATTGAPDEVCLAHFSNGYMRSWSSDDGDDATRIRYHHHDIFAALEAKLARYEAALRDVMNAWPRRWVHPAHHRAQALLATESAEPEPSKPGEECSLCRDPMLECTIHHVSPPSTAAEWKGLAKRVATILGRDDCALEDAARRVVRDLETAEGLVRPLVAETRAGCSSRSCGECIACKAVAWLEGRKK